MAFKKVEPSVQSAFQLSPPILQTAPMHQRHYDSSLEKLSATDLSQYVKELDENLVTELPKYQERIRTQIRHIDDENEQLRFRSFSRARDYMASNPLIIPALEGCNNQMPLKLSSRQELHQELDMQYHVFGVVFAADKTPRPYRLETICIDPALPGFLIQKYQEYNRNDLKQRHMCLGVLSALYNLCYDQDDDGIHIYNGDGAYPFSNVPLGFFASLLNYKIATIYNHNNQDTRLCKSIENGTILRVTYLRKIAYPSIARTVSLVAFTN